MHRFILYLSRLASDQGGEVFDSVCRIAPERNRRAGISAILLFDGQWFCQLIAGEGVRVRELLTTILLDERHIDMQLLADEAQDVTSGLHCWAKPLRRVVAGRDRRADGTAGAVRVYCGEPGPEWRRAVGAATHRRAEPAHQRLESITPSAPRRVPGASGMA